MAETRREQKLNRDEKARREKQLKKEKEHPINKFLNEKDDKGNLKYPMAERLRNYFLANPDPVLSAMRMSNALLHEIRFHKNKASEYYESYLDDSGTKKMYDSEGRLMTKEGCYVAWIKETQTIHLVLENLRQSLTNRLLSTVDENLFTFEQYDDFIEKTEKKVKELGYVLFPDKISIIEPV